MVYQKKGQSIVNPFQEFVLQAYPHKESKKWSLTSLLEFLITDIQLIWWVFANVSRIEIFSWMAMQSARVNRHERWHEQHITPTPWWDLKIDSYHNITHPQMSTYLLVSNCKKCAYYAHPFPSYFDAIQNRLRRIEFRVHLKLFSVMSIQMWSMSPIG